MERDMKDETGMRDFRERLAASGWEDLGGGWWSHPEVEGGDERFGMAEAIGHELDRRGREVARHQERVDGLAKILDQVRAGLGLEQASYSELPAAIPDLIVAAAEARRRADDMGAATVRFEQLVPEVLRQKIANDPTYRWWAELFRRIDEAAAAARDMAVHEQAIGALATIAFFNLNSVSESGATLAQVRKSLEALEKYGYKP